MFERGYRVGVAVSGGADSVCLLHVLRELAPEWNLHLSVLHLDHQLRGAESRADAAFTAELAARYGYPFHLRRVEVAAETGNLEQAARHARYGFFREMLESGGLDRVALGHTRSDQAETVLFRFLRGAGTAGLAGIRPVAAGMVRPLIVVERSEVEAWLRGRGIEWREDSTNRDPVFARNRIRHHLLPQLTREWNPALGRTLADTAEWALGEEAYWETEIDTLTAGMLEAAYGGIVLDLVWFRAQPLAVARRVVRRAIERVKGDLRSIDFGHVEAILEMAAAREGSGRLQVPGVDVMRSFDALRMAPPGGSSLDPRDYSHILPVPGSVELPGNTRIVAEIIDYKATSEVFDSVYNGGVECLDWGSVPRELMVRNWRPGDQYRPVGYSGDVKLKFLFQEARIPLWERRHWPVVTGGEAILWVKRFGPASACAARGDSKLLLTIRQVAE